MSFTLMRYKDGKATPIKLSIWDAFKGAPPPKRRLHKCPQCGKIHHPGTKHEPADATAKATPRARNEKSNKEAKPDASSMNEHNFTAKEDAKILELKADETTWAKIAESLGNGRSKSMVQDRYKQIKAAETKSEKPGDEKEEKIEEKLFEQMTKAEKKAYKARIAKEEGLKKKEAASKEKSGASAAVAKNDKARTSGTGSLLATNTNAPGIQDKQKWIAAASKHFDKTGQRITPEQAQKMAEEAAKK